MLKVGILSLYYNNSNFGGLLQAYALQKAIEELGYEAEEIKYDMYSYNKQKFVLRDCFRKKYYSTHLRVEYRLDFSDGYYC